MTSDLAYITSVMRARRDSVAVRMVRGDAEAAYEFDRAVRVTADLENQLSREE